jgi:hypothetical protein
MAMRVLSFNYIARGDYQSGATQARHSLDASPDDPQFLTMMAFFLEQSNEDPDEGLELGLRALAASPSTAPQSPRTCSRPSCSAMSAAPSPAQSSPTSARSRWRRAAPCSSTRPATFRCRSR